VVSRTGWAHEKTAHQLIRSVLPETKGRVAACMVYPPPHTSHLWMRQHDVNDDGGGGRCMGEVGLRGTLGWQTGTTLGSIS